MANGPPGDPGGGAPRTPSGGFSVDGSREGAERGTSATLVSPGSFSPAGRLGDEGTARPPAGGATATLSARWRRGRARGRRRRTLGQPRAGTWAGGGDRALAHRAAGAGASRGRRRRDRSEAAGALPRPPRAARGAGGGAGGGAAMTGPDGGAGAVPPMAGPDGGAGAGAGAAMTGPDGVAGGAGRASGRSSTPGTGRARAGPEGEAGDGGRAGGAVVTPLDAVPGDPPGGLRWLSASFESGGGDRRGSSGFDGGLGTSAGGDATRSW